MSGSDPSVTRTGRAGTSGTTPGSPEGGTSDDCPGRPFQTVLASPNPDAVSLLTEGELLDVVSIDSPVRAVVATRLNGVHVGAVARDILRLRRCIQEGHQYEAEVLRVAGGSVSVVIRPR